VSSEDAASRQWCGQIVDPQALGGLPDKTASIGESLPITELYATGIKVIDMLCPIRRGGSFEMIGPAGCGQLVFLGELVRRWCMTRKCVTVVIGAAGAATTDTTRLSTALIEPDSLQIRSSVVFIDPPPATSEHSEQADMLVAGGLSLARLISSEGRDVLLVCETTDLRSELRRDLLSGSRIDHTGAVTICLYSIHGNGETPRGPSADVDTTVAFHSGLAKQGWYPAISPLASRSRMLDEGHCSSAHSRVAERLRFILGQALRVQAYLTQGLLVLEDITQVPATWVDMEHTTDDLDDILHDKLASRSPSELMNRGRLA